MTLRIYLLFICCVGILFSSCHKDSDAHLSLDEQLLDKLGKASKNGAIGFFELPLPVGDLNRIPQDPKNKISSDKVALGKFLFHETNLAINPKYPEGAHTYSCASCHHAAAGFQSGIRQGIGEGGSGFGFAGESRVPNTLYPTDSLDIQPIRSPSAMNGAYQEATLWNGQFGATGPNIGTESNWTEGTPKAVNKLGYQGLETQAIAGLTVHRMGFDDEITNNPIYQDHFAKAFPGVNTQDLFTTELAGLAIAAYERTVLSNEAPFQKWLRGYYSAMTDRQKEGAILFFGKAGCNGCHTGPALNAMQFDAIGMNDLKGSGVYGNFNEDLSHLGRGSFTGITADNFKFKVPQLYNLKDVKFFGHGATFNSIRDVIAYKNIGEVENKQVPSSQISPLFKPLNLSEEEIDKLTEFVEESLYDDNLQRYVPEMLPSGYCFPNGDAKSKTDLGCQ